MRRLIVPFMLVTAWAQEPASDANKPHPPMPEPKNLKVLKVAPDELIPVMRAFSAGLGVRCDHCHVKGDFASDENPRKEFARTMIVMNQQVNSNFPDGKMHVTCYTCHRGETEPKTQPPAKAAEPKPHT